MPPLGQLRRLNLLKAPITETGLDGIQCLTGLHTLNLGGAQVSQLKGLAALRELRDLDLRNTLTNDDGLREIAGLHHLERLVLDATRVTDLKSLAGLKQLRVLGVCGIPIGDAQMLDIARLGNSVSYTSATPRSPTPACSCPTALPHLELVNVDGTGVTETGVHLLKIALPKCRVP